MGSWNVPTTAQTLRKTVLLFIQNIRRFTEKMLTTSGDLIPVQPSAITIPWTRRKSQILNFLHRGPVTFSTLAYDTNVGDISALSAYFNPERISVKDLNSRFGQYPSSFSSLSTTSTIHR